MKCCGQDRTTKFCPDCGTDLTLGPLGSLLRHVKNHVRNANSDAARIKWQAWLDELEKAIAALAEKDSTDGPND